MLPIIEFKQHPLYDDFCNIFDDQQKINFVRECRDMLLIQSDFSQLPDVNVDKTAWSKYRQKLRDYMDFYDPSNLNPIFPKHP